MTTKSYLIRIGAQGAERVTSEVMKVEQALNRTGQAAEAAGAKAERAAARQQAAYLRTADAAARADPNRRQAVIDAVVGVNANAGRADRSAQVFERQMLADERAARALRAALDPLAAAQDRYNDELIELNGLYTRGAITQQQFLQGQAALRQRLDESTAALGRNTNGLTRNQLASRLNLTRQGADVLVTGAMGMNPAMIALQQGPQILDALATSGLRASAAMVALGVAAGGAAIAAGVMGAAYLRAESSVIALDRAATGLGRTAGLSAAELEAMAQIGAEQARISASAARDQAAAYVATGRIGGEVIQGLIALSKDYAVFVGRDMASATESLATSFADPAKAARDMTRQFGLMDQATLDTIDSLVKQGDQLAAQRILLDSLTMAVLGHAEKVGEIESAWDAVGRSISDAIDGLGRFLYMTRDERIEQLEGQLENARRDRGNPGTIRNLERRLFVERQLRDWNAGWEEEQAQVAARNQREQLEEDRARAAARGRSRSGEAEARREEQRRRRAEDSAAQLELEIARLTNDQDRVRALEQEARQRDRIRDLIDAGATADAARTQAAGEMARLADAQGIATAERGRELGRQAEIEVTRLLNERSVLQVIEDRAALERLILDYQQRGFDLAEATAQAESDRARIVEARAAAIEREVEAARRSREIELLRLEGRSDQDPTLRGLNRQDAIQRRAREIEERQRLDFGQGVAEATRQIDEELQATARGALRGGLRGFINDIRRGDIGDALGNQFERASDRAIDRLLDAILSTDWGSLFNGGGGKGVGGWISAGLNFLFGRNAVGTESWRGGLTWVGENGPELISAPRGARITPAFRAQGEGRAYAASSPTLVFDLSGAVMTEDLMRQMQDMVARGQAQIRGEVPAIAVGAVSQARQRRVIG